MSGQAPDGLKAKVLAKVEEVSPPLHKFLTRDDKPFPLIREVLGIAVFLMLLASVLWGVTGQPFLQESPVVVVESESMMHCSPPFASPGRDCSRADGVGYGRVGTIDPGDLILVFDAESRDDIQTWADAVGDCSPTTGYLDCACDGREGHGACGDVIIFTKSHAQRTGDTTPIIHRAMLYLEIHGGDRFSIDLPESWGCSDLRNVPLADLQSPCLGRLGFGNLHEKHSQFAGLGPEASGFLTRGDNNDAPDQIGLIEPLPVRPDLVLGKARGEIPWIGLVKLFVSDLGAGTQNFARAPGDVKVLMWLSLGAIILAPAGFERLQKWRQQRAE